MGSKYSKSNNEEVKSKPQCWGSNFDDNSIKNNKYDIDTYSSSHQTQENTDSTILSIKQITENENKKKENEEEKEKEKEKEKLCTFKFEWKGWGSSVFLAGDFLNNWKDHTPMVKNAETQIFELILDLPKKIHYFKFIVDNKWVCSDQYPTSMDNSNNQNNYNCKYPLAHELNSTAPNAIVHYKPCFNIDYQSNQDKIDAKLNFNYKEKNPLTENNTYKKILICPHEKLMHFCQNINDIKNTNKRYIKGCTTIRNKHKYLTIVYYKPKPKRENDSYAF